MYEYSDKYLGGRRIMKAKVPQRNGGRRDGRRR
jgi:hypothetical protein